MKIEYGNQIKIDVTSLVYKYCIEKIKIPSNKNSLFGDDFFGIVKSFCISFNGNEKIYNEFEIISIPFENNLTFKYGIIGNMKDVTEIILNKCISEIKIPSNKNIIFGDPCSGTFKYVFIDDLIFRESDIIMIYPMENKFESENVIMNLDNYQDKIKNKNFLHILLRNDCDKLIIQKLLDDFDYVVYNRLYSEIILKKVYNFRKYLLPITQCIPQEKIIQKIVAKTKILANVRPMFQKHIYDNEQDYYNDYQTSLFGLTHSKNGYDSLRHYEILMNGCIPYFCDLDIVPKEVLSLYPKDKINETNEFYQKIKNYSIEEFNNHPNLVKIYNNHLEYLIQFTKDHLTTEQMVKYVLDKLKIKKVAKVLFLNRATNYQNIRCLLLHGFKKLLNDDCHEFPQVKHLYKASNQAYGKGFTYTNLLNDSYYDEYKNKTLQDDIKNNRYDLIIYADYVANSYNNKPLWDLVSKHYDPQNVIFINNDDHVNHFLLQDFYNLIELGHYCFILEYQNFQKVDYIMPFIDYFKGIIKHTFHGIVRMKVPNILETRNKYLPLYQMLLEQYELKDNKILEIGDGNVTTIAVWHEYFTQSRIYSILTNINQLDYINYQRIYFETDLDQHKFDIIVIHSIDLNLLNIEYYISLLSENGIMILENYKNIACATPFVFYKSFNSLVFKNC